MKQSFKESPPSAASVTGIIEHIMGSVRGDSVKNSPEKSPAYIVWCTEAQKT